MSVLTPESPGTETPKWLEALEKKINKPRRLAHDIGAGSPCFICKEGCKGLNLHFWRKICIECKCRKEDHDVQEEEDYAQFEILFGAKKVKRITVKFNSQQKTFDWFPPNVPQDLALDYLNALPESKLPISNTEGAKYRKQQLEKQLPLHDVDPNACHALSEQEILEFQKYLDNLKDNVIGQGKVLKYKVSFKNAVPETANVQNPQCASIQGRLAIDRLSENTALSENIQSESHPARSIYEIVSSEALYPEYELPEGQAAACQPIHLSKSSDLSLPEAQKSQKLEGNRVNNLGKVKNIVIKGYVPPNINKLQYTEDNATSNLKNSINGRPKLELKTPSSFMNYRRPIEDKQNNNAEPLQDDNCNENDRGLLPWSGQSDSLPVNASTEGGKGQIQIPYEASVTTDSLNKFGEMNIGGVDLPFVPLQESKNLARKAEYIQQLGDEVPKDDSLEDFPAPPQTCHQCTEVLSINDVVISANRADASLLWHASCFICDVCKELLVDLMYFYAKEKVYCGRHFAEIMNIPRCFACDELIFMKEYTRAEDKSFHFRHFCCYNCDEPLGGKQYIPKDGNPICLVCYQSEYGKNCHTCKTPITVNQQRVSWKDLDYHASPDCFRCAKCLKSLLGGRFVFKNGNTYCSKECVEISQ